jgi:hypothetical protein
MFGNAKQSVPNTVEANQVKSKSRQKRHQPLYKFQRRHHLMRGAIAPEMGRFQMGMRA